MKECRGRRGRREQVGEEAGRKPDDWTDEGCNWGGGECCTLTKKKTVL